MEVLSEILPEQTLKSVQKLFEEFSLGGLKDADLNPEYKGYKLNPGFSSETVRFGYEDWSLRSGDILLASFPKTGTNWMIDILRRMVYDEKNYQVSKHLPLSTMVFEAGTELKFRVLDQLPFERRIMATHLPAGLLNLEQIRQNKAKIIYILRNPKDQIVSWYHFALKIPHLVNHPLGHMINQGFENFLRHSLKGDLPVNSKPGEGYPEHILSFYKVKNQNNIYFVYFEDLKKDFCGEVKRLSEFLGLSLSDERINLVSEQCSFDNMKKDIGTSKNQDLEKFQTANMRKGEIGGWKEYFTVSQSDEVDRKYDGVLKDTDINFTYC